MNEVKNRSGQPIGFSVEGWQPCERPSCDPIEGHSCRIEAYQPEQHNRELFDAFIKNTDLANWTYLPYGPFDSFEAFDSWSRADCQGDDPLFHAVIDLSTGRAVGLASYLRITPAAGVIEVGHIHFSPLLQRTRLAT
ncbi:MAG: GNAT family N-acetyltransferase, partial [Gammaproteobacteria bacterium]|nr:GNAT family N-acetyltransferase [Gammaproteobacteria bacterium]